jgi:FixJ family two-component response regulator
MLVAASASLTFSPSADLARSAADFLDSPRLCETACLIADVNMPAMLGSNSTNTLSLQGKRFRQSS